MPRGPRFDAPGVTHHVRLRGIDRHRIFLDDADRLEFIARLDRLIQELGCLCLAWALMPNHVHLVLRSGNAGLSLLMRRLATGYAVYFNNRHRRIGHVFHNRFLSSVVDTDAYLAAAVAYVHRNPVEAKLVLLDDLAAYAWCGHGAVVGARPPHAFEAAAMTLALFERDPAAAHAAVANARRVPAPRDWKPRLPGPTRAPADFQGANFDAIAAHAARAAGSSVGELLSRSRTRAAVRAREMLARAAVQELGMSLTAVGRRLGVSQPAVSKMLRRAKL